MESTSEKPVRPLWREPAMLGITAAVLLLSLGIWFQDRIFPSHTPPPDATSNKSALPAGGAGGGFCDLPVPVVSTPYNPSTRKSE